MRKSYGIFLLFSISLIFSCSRQNGISFKEDDRPLEVHSDSLQIGLSFKKPSEHRKDGLYEIWQQSISGDRLIYTLNTKDFSAESDTMFNVAVPYEPSMDNSKIVLKKPGGNKHKKEISTAPCCITTSRLLKTDFRLILSDKSNIQSPLKLITQFNFPVNSYEIGEGQLTSKDVKLLKDFLRQKDSVRSIEILISNSPEGDEFFNDTLADLRAGAVKNWLINTMREAGYPDSSAITGLVKVIKKEEDWDGFNQMLDSINISESGKAAIREVIKEKIPLKEKEKKVKDLVEGNFELVEKAFSPLRKATLVLESGSMVRRDSELDSIAVSFLKSPGKINLEKVFSREEWLYTIGRVKGTQGKKTLMAAYYKTFPDDYTIFNDLGVLSLAEDTACPLLQVCGNNKTGITSAPANTSISEKGYEQSAVAYLSDTIRAEKKDLGEKYEFIYEPQEVDSVAGNTIPGLDTSLSFFEKAEKNLSENSGKTCNLTCVYSLQGRYEAAINYFSKSLLAKESEEARYNIGLVYAMGGNYSEAIRQIETSYAGEDRNYNLALLYLLEGKYGLSRVYVENYLSNKPDDAQALYLKALIFARLKDENQARQTLEQVCHWNSDLCARSETDLEFSSLKKR